ncbi:unnamed protein product [Durusdinium trenchii]|uniref:Uncharacterized protein n=1 Tax=Durusdinium trenchii TaxID=1381693 RepID=A0ABP0LFP1_9DINO
MSTTSTSSTTSSSSFTISSTSSTSSTRTRSTTTYSSTSSVTSSSSTRTSSTSTSVSQTFTSTTSLSNTTSSTTSTASTTFSSSSSLTTESSTSSTWTSFTSSSTSSVFDSTTSSQTRSSSQSSSRSETSTSTTSTTSTTTSGAELPPPLGSEEFTFTAGAVTIIAASLGSVALASLLLLPLRPKDFVLKAAKGANQGAQSAAQRLREWLLWRLFNQQVDEESEEEIVVQTTPGPLVREAESPAGQMRQLKALKLAEEIDTEELVAESASDHSGRPVLASPSALTMRRHIRKRISTASGEASTPKEDASIALDHTDTHSSDELWLPAQLDDRSFSHGPVQDQEGPSSEHLEIQCTGPRNAEASCRKYSRMAAAAQRHPRGCSRTRFAGRGGVSEGGSSLDRGRGPDNGRCLGVLVHETLDASSLTGHEGTHPKSDQS